MSYFDLRSKINCRRTFRCQQHEANNVMVPLAVFENARDAHEATELNLEKNYFCLLRLQLLRSHRTNATSLHLAQPSSMHFDRMWIYSYDG